VARDLLSNSQPSQRLEFIWNNPEGDSMKNKLWMLSVKIQNILNREEGQDLIEYTLVVALIALAATAGMKVVATDINAAFTSIGGKLVTYTS
jgi:pilus assembly protein Flp/PilA